MNKLKSTLLIIILSFIAHNSFSQDDEKSSTDNGSSSQAFGDGTHVIYLGFGVPPNSVKYDFKRDFGFSANEYVYKLNNYGTGVLKYEYGLHKYFGLGLNLEYSASFESYKKTDETSSIPDKESKNKEMAAYFRLNGHLPLIQKLDIYGGVGLGYSYQLYKYTETLNETILQNKKETELSFDYQFTIGARFMVKDKIGLFVEFGWASTPLQVGIAFKF